jgi:hypothetical protein
MAQRRGPSAAQRHAPTASAAQQRAQVAHKRAQRRATYGSYRVADVRTWFSWQWLWALIALVVVTALPLTFGDGPAAEVVWIIALTIGVLLWGIWVARLHAAQSPARQAGAQNAALTPQLAHVEAARRALTPPTDSIRRRSARSPGDPARPA